MESAAVSDQLTPEIVDAYERLDKWKGCLVPGAPARMVYEHNRSRAAATGFPTRLKVGSDYGLTDHETAAVFGWTTGDYRMVNPVARGLDVVEFDEHPFLPHETTKAACRLSREDVMPYVRVLGSALSKLPALDCHRQRLWRGHRRRINHEVGSVVTMRGFTSVTRDRENALEFATKANEGRSPARTLVCVLDHFSARCVSKLSARREEMEVLFPADRTFRVVDPPGDTATDDLMAVRRAAERLRKERPGAEIDLVYVEEVGRPSRSDGGGQCNRE
ncbi:hypothetical protein ACHAWF_016565 [Thalassiosira exigua]